MHLRPLYRSIRQRLPQLRHGFLQSHLDHPLLNWDSATGLSIGESAPELLQRLAGQQGGLRLAFAPHRGLPEERELLCLDTELEAKKTGLIPVKPTLDNPPPKMAWLALGVVQFTGDKVRQAPLLLAPVRLEGNVIKLAGHPTNDLIVNSLIEAIWQERCTEPATSWKQWLSDGTFWTAAKKDIGSVVGVRLDLETCWIGDWDFEVLDKLAALHADAWPDDLAPQPRAPLPAEARPDDWLFVPEEFHHAAAREKLLAMEHVVLPGEPAHWSAAIVNTAMTLAANGRSTLVVGDPEELAWWEDRFSEIGIRSMVLNLSKQGSQSSRLALHLTDAWSRNRPDTEQSEAVVAHWHWAIYQWQAYSALLTSRVGASEITIGEVTAHQSYLDRTGLPDLDPGLAAGWRPKDWAVRLNLLKQMAEKASAVTPWMSHPFEESLLLDASEERRERVKAAFAKAITTVKSLLEAGKRLSSLLGASESATADSLPKLNGLLQQSHLLARANAAKLPLAGVVWCRETWKSASPALKTFAQANADLNRLREVSGIDPDPNVKEQLEKVRRGLHNTTPGLLRGLLGDRSNVDRQLQLYFPALERGAVADQIRKVEAALSQIELQKGYAEIRENLVAIDPRFVDLSGAQAHFMIHLSQAVEEGAISESLAEQTISGKLDLSTPDQVLRTALTERASAIQELNEALAFPAAAKFGQRFAELPLSAQEHWLQRRAQALDRLWPWVEWLQACKQCAESGVGAFAEQLRRQTLTPDMVARSAQESYWLSLAKYAVAQPSIRGAELGNIEQAARELPELLQELALAKATLAGAQVWNYLSEAPSAKLETLRALVLNPAAAPPVKDLLQLVGDQLPLMCPIILAEPWQVGDCMAPQHRFDLCLLNPLKQADWQLAPTLLRSRQVAAFVPESAKGWAPLQDVETVTTIERTHSAQISGWTPFQSSLASHLDSRGYSVEIQPAPGIDLRIADPIDPTQTLLGITVDIQVAELDRLIETSDYPVYRTWTLAWLRQPQSEWEKILGLLDHQLRAAHPSLPTETYMKAFPSLPFGVSSLSEIAPDQLVAAVAEVVSVEAPVHLATVARRLAEGAGLGRLGARSLQALEAAFQSGSKNSLFVRRKNFLYSTDGQALPIRDRRGFPRNQRGAEWIAPEEIDACLQAGGDPQVWLAAEDWVGSAQLAGK